MPPGNDPSHSKRRSRVNTGGIGNTDSLLYPTTSGRMTPPTRQGFEEEEDEYSEPPRQSTSAIRPHNTPPRITSPQTSAIPPRRQQRTRDFPLQRPRTTMQQPYPPAQQSPITKNVHWLLPLGVGMVAMLVLWITGSWILAWTLQRYDDIRYGNPRTYQTDAVVGHGDDSVAHPSHFVAINLNRQAVVIELMAGAPAKSVSYVVPYYIVGEGADLTPITLEFRDVTGDNRKDMIIHIHLRTQDQTFVFVNDGTKFRPPNANDRIQL